jgi:hypothetical protein
VNSLDGLQNVGLLTAQPFDLADSPRELHHPLIKSVRTHQHHTNSTPLQTIKNFKKSFEVKQSKYKT